MLANSGGMIAPEARDALMATFGFIDAPLHEQYFAVAPEPVRAEARSLADTWIENNRPDMLTAQQVPTQ